MKCLRPNCRSFPTSSGLCAEHWQHARTIGLVGLVSGDRSREHIQALLDARWSYAEIAAEAGLVVQVLRLVMAGRRIRATSERRILSVPVLPHDNGLIDSCGFIRRVEALSWMGHPVRSYADRLMVDARSVWNYKLRPTVTIALHNRMRAVYDELSTVAGPCRVTAGVARGRGYAPPLAWDDESIDDPASQPVGVRERESKAGRPYAETLAEYQHLTAGGLSYEHAAKRLGLTLSALEQALYRARRAAA